MFALEPLLDNAGARYGVRLRAAGVAADDFGVLPDLGMVWAPTLTVDGDVGRIEYTRSPLSAIANAVADWFAWGPGDIDGTLVATTASEFLTPEECATITAFRVVRTTTAGTYDVYMFGALDPDRAGAFVTPDGGKCSLKTWDAASAAPTVAGNLVSFNDPGEVALAVAGANLPYTLGVLFDSDCPPGGIAPVVTGGEADVLLVDATPAVIAELASLSTTVDGRVESVAPPVAASWSEYTNWIGQFKEANAGGVDQLVRVALRF